MLNVLRKKLVERLMLEVKFRMMKLGLLLCLLGLGCCGSVWWYMEKDSWWTYEVGGLDAETDGLRPVVIGCDIVDRGGADATR